MQVQVLASPPDVYGDLNASPPEAILTKSAPALDVKLVPVSGVVTVSVYVRFDGDWARHRQSTVTLYAYESTEPIYFRIAISDKVTHACIVQESGNGTLQAHLRESFPAVTTTTPSSSTTSATGPIRWKSFRAFPNQRTFVIDEDVSAFVMVFNERQPLFEANGEFLVDGRTVELKGPAWEGATVVVGYFPAPETEGV